MADTMKIKCDHDITERETAAVADGLCPICLQRELALYEQAMPADPILYAISKTDGSFLAVNKKDYDALAKSNAALKVERDELLIENAKKHLGQAKEYVGIKAKLAACERGFQEIIDNQRIHAGIKHHLKRYCDEPDECGLCIARKYLTGGIDAALKENEHE